MATDILDIIVGIVIFIDVYAIVLFRLLLRYDIEKATGRRESTFDMFFSIPRRAHLRNEGHVILKRYWSALSVMALCFAYVAATRMVDGDLLDRIS